jgi:chromosome segregation ATPase
MSETKKLTQEELQSIQELQKQFNQFIFELGNVEAQIQGLLHQKSLLETEKEGIVSDIKTLTNKEKDLVTSLQEKYGNGSIDPQTGEIVSL